MSIFLIRNFHKHTDENFGNILSRNTRGKREKFDKKDVRTFPNIVCVIEQWKEKDVTKTEEVKEKLMNTMMSWMNISRDKEEK